MLKYPSLENHYNILKSRKLMSVFDELFYATEKIHGSNMSIEITKDNVKYFSRNREVTLDDGALGSGLASTSNLEFIIQVGKSMLDKASKVIIYGELYGAGIQNMEYQENIENVKQFRVFDVFVFEEDRAYTLSLEDLAFLFTNMTVPRLTEIKTLREWLNSELPEKSYLGGPIEGLVYKPLNGQELVFNEDSGSVENYLGVKHKTEQFAEVKKNKNAKKKAELQSNELAFLENVERYFTEQRLNNLLSKGDIELSLQNLSKIIPAFLEDVSTDYAKDNPENYFDRQLLNKRFSNKVVNLVKTALIREI